MISIADIPGSAIEYSNELTELALEAEWLLKSTLPRTTILAGMLAWGFPKLAIFLFDLRISEEGYQVWAIVGEIPPSYLPTRTLPTAYDALDAYLGELDTWVEGTRAGNLPSSRIPILGRQTLQPLPPTEETLADLEKRIDFIGNNILIPLEAELKAERAF